MIGEDESGTLYSILTDRAEIGQKITIYANENSAEYKGGDRHWYPSEKQVRNSSSAGVVMFTPISLGNILLIVYVIRKMFRADKRT